MCVCVCVCVCVCTRSSFNGCGLAVMIFLSFIYIRVINAFNGSETLKVILTTGSGERTPCTENEFETDELSFMDTSNRSLIAVGWYNDDVFTVAIYMV